ncbi:unnamed protein product [Mucor hiemalis]
MLAPVNFSEAQIHHMWNMTYSAFEGCSIKALVCEKTGNASTIRKNTIRVLATSEKRTNRLMGHRIDTIYKHEDYELGCIEVGKDSVSTTDNKYLDDGMIKLPKCVKDMLCVLINDHPGKADDSAT